jgi:5-methylcytosine-specific restriction endonuclease McrA
MSTTLVLNATFEPLSVVPLKRAVLLVLAQKAEVVEEGEAEFHSASLTMRVPSVVRLTYFVKVPYRARIPLNRRAVIARDKGRCQYCFKAGDTIDHVTPRARGGQHSWENVVAACRRCNGAKGDRLLSELGWKLPRKPFAPTGTQWLIVGLARIDESWTPYLLDAAPALGAAPA